MPASFHDRERLLALQERRGVVETAREDRRRRVVLVPDEQQERLGDALDLGPVVRRPERFLDADPHERSVERRNLRLRPLLGRRRRAFEHDSGRVPVCPDVAGEEAAEREAVDDDVAYVREGGDGVEHREGVGLEERHVRLALAPPVPPVVHEDDVDAQRDERLGRLDSEPLDGGRVATEVQHGHVRTGLPEENPVEGRPVGGSDRQLLERGVREGGRGGGGDGGAGRPRSPGRDEPTLGEVHRGAAGEGEDEEGETDRVVHPRAA